MNYTLDQKLITYALATQLIDSAIEHAKSLQLAISVAIVDPFGELIAFAK